MFRYVGPNFQQLFNECQLEICKSTNEETFDFAKRNICLEEVYLPQSHIQDVRLSDMVWPIVCNWKYLGTLCQCILLPSYHKILPNLPFPSGGLQELRHSDALTETDHHMSCTCVLQGIYYLIKLRRLWTAVDTSWSCDADPTGFGEGTKRLHSAFTVVT